LTSAFDTDAALRRVRPDRHKQRLVPRIPVRLLPDDLDARTIGPVLLDTCVFIDVTASPADHVLAGTLAGTLTRTQEFGPDARRELLFDCLLFASARRNGLTLLTANHRDFDLLSQVLPDGKVAFYQARAKR
jgi:hypothetical protein